MIAVYVIIFFIYTYIGATYEHLAYFLSDGSKKLCINPLVTGFPFLWSRSVIYILACKKDRFNITFINRIAFWWCRNGYGIFCWSVCWSW